MSIVRQLHGLLQKGETDVRITLKYRDELAIGMITGNGMQIPFRIEGPIDEVDAALVSHYNKFLENRKTTLSSNAEVTEEEQEETKKPVVSTSSSSKKKPAAKPAEPPKPEVPKIDPEVEKALKRAGPSSLFKLFTDVDTQQIVAQMDAKERANVDKMIASLQTHFAKPNYDKDMATYIIDSIHREIVAKLKNTAIADKTKEILNAIKDGGAAAAPKPKAEEPKKGFVQTAIPISEEEVPFDEDEEADNADVEEEAEEEEDVPASDVLEGEMPDELYQQPPPPPPPPPASKLAPEAAAPKRAPKSAPVPQPASIPPKPVKPAPGAIADDLLF